MKSSKPPRPYSGEPLYPRSLPSGDIEVGGAGYRVLFRSDGSFKGVQRMHHEFKTWGVCQPPQALMRRAEGVLAAFLNAPVPA